jgi:hypothetical protein
MQVIAMAKPVRFTRKIEILVTDAIADGFELLAQDQLMSVSNHARQALAAYLRAFNIPITSPPPAHPNGQHHHQEQTHHGE